MAFQETLKKEGLVTRRNLTADNLAKRLKNYYSDQEIINIICSAKSFDCWTDGDIAIVYTGKHPDPRFVAIANENYTKLIEV